jgi:hypothetical protein
VNAVCEWLATTTGSTALRESLYAYPFVESIHVLTLVLFGGMTLMLDLRLMGLAMRRVPVSDVVAQFPWIAGGFVIMVVTGALLFYANPVRSFHNIFFRIKMLMLLMAGLNAWVFQVTAGRRIAEWSLSATPPRGARVAGAASLVLWAAIIVAGRMIAYNWFDCEKPQTPLVQWATGCRASAD